MPFERGLDPRKIERPHTRPVGLEVKGDIKIINDSIALRYRSNGRSVLEVTTWRGIPMLDGRDCNDEVKILQFMSQSGPSFDSTYSMEFRLRKEEEVLKGSFLYVAEYRIDLAAARDHMIALFVSSPDDLDIKPHSRTVEPPEKLRQVRTSAIRG